MVLQDLDHFQPNRHKADRRVFSPHKEHGYPLAPPIHTHTVLNHQGRDWRHEACWRNGEPKPKQKPRQFRQKRYSGVKRACGRSSLLFIAIWGTTTLGRRISLASSAGKTHATLV